MATIISSWLVGSVEQMASETVVINGGNVAISQGNRYLRHASAAIDAMTIFAAALTTGGVGAPTCSIRQNRKVRLTGSANFTVTWGGGPWRDFLGFTGNLSGASTYDAPNISKYLLSPGWPVTLTTRSGVSGYPVENERTTMSVDGTMIDSDLHSTQTWQEMEWKAVAANRARNDDATWQGGTWHGFRLAVLVPNHRFQVYEEVTEDASSTSAVSFPSALGTYKRRKLPKSPAERTHPQMNSLWDFGIEAIVQAEYS